MKVIFKQIMIVIALFTVWGGAYADQYAGEFMSTGVGARALAMGGAFAAVADDASTIYWNPAGMADTKGAEVSSVKRISQSGVDSSYTYLSLDYNSGENTGAFGASFLSQSFGGIMITDTQGNQVGGLTSAGDNVVYLSYAKKLAGWVSGGLSLKVLFGNYPTGSGSTGYNGFGEDLGILIDMGHLSGSLNGLKFAINAQDLYTTMNWGSGGGFSGGMERVEPNIKLGLAYLPFSDVMKALDSRVTLAADYDSEYSGAYHLGAEYLWNGMIALRAGVQNYISYTLELQQEAGWSLGGGIKWYFLEIDYAFIKSEISPMQYISLMGIF